MNNSKTHSVRFGATDEKEPVLLAWDGELFHCKMLEITDKYNVSVGVAYMKNSDYISIEQVLPMTKSKHFKGWQIYGNKTMLLDKMKRLLPKITRVEFPDKRLNFRIR